MDVEQKTAAPSWVTNGPVLGWHVVVLYGLIFAVTAVVAGVITRSTDPMLRNAWFGVIWPALILTLTVALVVFIPELRRLVTKRLTRVSATPQDILLVIGVMLTWGLGTNRLLFHYPLFLIDPGWAYDLLEMGRLHRTDATLLFSIALNAIVFAPLFEEIVFRGLLLNLWLKDRGTWAAIWMSSLTFGLWHLQWAPFATVMGLFFALVYMRYRSLLMCILLHSLYNALTQRPMLSRLFLEKDRATAASISSWMLELALFLLFIPILWLFWQRFRPQSPSNS